MLNVSRQILLRVVGGGVAMCSSAFVLREYVPVYRDFAAQRGKEREETRVREEEQSCQKLGLLTPVEAQKCALVSRSSLLSEQECEMI